MNIVLHLALITALDDACDDLCLDTLNISRASSYGTNPAFSQKAASYPGYAEVILDAGLPQMKIVLIFIR